MKILKPGLKLVWLLRFSHTFFDKTRPSPDRRSCNELFYFNLPTLGRTSVQNIQSLHTGEKVVWNFQSLHTRRMLFERFNLSTPGKIFFENSISTHQKLWNNQSFHTREMPLWNIQSPQSGKCFLKLKISNKFSISSNTKNLFEIFNLSTPGECFLKDLIFPHLGKCFLKIQSLHTRNNLWNNQSFDTRE